MVSRAGRQLRDVCRADKRSACGPAPGSGSHRRSGAASTVSKHASRLAPATAARSACNGCSPRSGLGGTSSSVACSPRPDCLEYRHVRVHRDKADRAVSVWSPPTRLGICRTPRPRSSTRFGTFPAAGARLIAVAHNRRHGRRRRLPVRDRRYASPRAAGRCAVRSRWRAPRAAADHVQLRTAVISRADPFDVKGIDRAAGIRDSSRSASQPRAVAVLSWWLVMPRASPLPPAAAPGWFRRCGVAGLPARRSPTVAGLHGGTPSSWPKIDLDAAWRPLARHWRGRRSNSLRVVRFRRSRPLGWRVIGRCACLRRSVRGTIQARQARTCAGATGQSVRVFDRCAGEGRTPTPATSLASRCGCRPFRRAADRTLTDGARSRGRASNTEFWRRSCASTGSDADGIADGIARGSMCSAMWLVGHGQRPSAEVMAKRSDMCLKKNGKRATWSSFRTPRSPCRRRSSASWRLVDSE